MIKNYLKIAIRNILKNKSVSILNIVGLAVGLSIAILIFLWVKYEFNYDEMHSKKNRIYQLWQTQFYTSRSLMVTSMPGPLAAQLKSDFPEIEETFRFRPQEKTILYNNKKFNESIYYTDKGLFNVFDFEFIYGNPETVFNEFNSIVITDKMAQKYFGSENPMGRILILDNTKNFKISAVVKELPRNSSFRADFCIPFEHVSEIGVDPTRYSGNFCYTYVLLAKNASMDNVNEKIKEYFKIAMNYPEATQTLWLWPLSKVHLYSPRGGGLIRSLRLFIVISVFVLVIACINFMNLSTARSTLRSKEIGLRKVLGAERINIIKQFIFESVFITFLAVVLACSLVEFFLPAFNRVASHELEFHLLNKEILLSILGLLAITGFLAGSYPALYLSSFKPIEILKGGQVKGKSGVLLRRILVIFQFSLSIMLIIGTMIIFKQQTFLTNKDIGFNKENVMYIDMKKEINDKFDIFKPILLQNPDIKFVSRSLHLPTNINYNRGGISWEGEEEPFDILFHFSRIDVDYDKVFEMNMVEGRFFSNEYHTDSEAVILNESAIKAMGMNNPIGKSFFWGRPENKFNIIGIVNDFNFLHLSREISPLVLFLYTRDNSYMFLKVNSQKLNRVKDDIEEKWNMLFPNYPFVYGFLDDNYKAMYAKEEQTGNLFKSFTILAIIISCLGLFGLASYIAEQKTKEIGIRKVMGSTVSSIIMSMSKEFMKWVFLANIIAWPVCWYFGNQFLSQYANRAEMSITIFIVSALASLFIAFVTVSSQVFRAARSNPIEALKYE